MLEVQATLELAAGEPAQALETARALLTMLTHEHATNGRAYRAAAELEALAAARLGDKTAATGALGLADAASPPTFPSLVERAESSLRRAEVLAALGRSADAASTGRAALADLATQHPDSPRLAQARRFAGVKTGG
jgi:hypothetical protein